MKTFSTQEIERFVDDHMQSKAEHNELEMAGISLGDAIRFTHELALYKTALFEGICNGIVMCGGKIEGIDIDNC